MFVHGLMKMLVVSVGVVILGCAAAVLVVPPSEKERKLRREVEARTRVERINREIWNYYHDHGRFPPGDGSGSRALVEALSPRMSFSEDSVTGMGHFRNPLSPDTEIIYYRNNQTPQGPPRGAWNEGSFDLWCRDARGWEDGVNNWSWRVPSP